jgi:predicted cation transporter
MKHSELWDINLDYVNKPLISIAITAILLYVFIVMPFRKYKIDQKKNVFFWVLRILFAVIILFVCFCNQYYFWWWRSTEV